MKRNLSVIIKAIGWRGGSGDFRIRGMVEHVTCSSIYTMSAMLRIALYRNTHFHSETPNICNDAKDIRMPDLFLSTERSMTT